MAPEVLTDDQRRVRRRSTFSGCLIGCAVIVAIVVIALAVIAVRLFQAPAPPPEEKESLEAKPARVAPQAPGAHSDQPPTLSLDDQVKQLKEAARSKRRMPVHFVATQKAVNAKLAQEATQHASADVSDLHVYFGEHAIAITGQIKWQGRTVHLTVRAEPVVEGGQTHIRILEAKAGNVGLPDSVKQDMQRRADEAMKKQWPGLKVNKLSVSPGRVEAEGVTKGQ